MSQFNSSPTRTLALVVLAIFIGMITLGVLSFFYAPKSPEVVSKIISVFSYVLIGGTTAKSISSSTEKNTPPVETKPTPENKKEE